MAGINLAAIGAGLGEFAKQYQAQRAQQERTQMLQMQIQQYQQQMREKQEQEQAASIRWGLQGGGGEVKPVGQSGDLSQLGNIPGASAPTGGGGGGGVNGGAHWTPEGLSALQKTEGGWDQVHYPSGRTPSGVKSSASGGFGYLDSTWREFAPKAGVDLAQYPRASMAPEDVQRKVAAITPISHWTGSKDGVPWNPRAQQLARNPAYVTGGGTAPASAGDEGGGGAPSDGGTGQTVGAGGYRYDVGSDEAARLTGQAPGPGGQQVAQAGPTGTAPIPKDLRPQLNKIIPPEVNGRMSETALKAKIDQICPNCSARAKLSALDEEKKRLAPEERQRFEIKMKQWEHELAREDEAAKHARDRAEHVEDRGIARKEKLEDQATAPGPIIRGGPGGTTPYVVNPRTRKAAPIIDETTGQPLTDAERLGTGGSGSASAGREKDLVGEIKRLDDEYREANPTASKAEIDGAHFANRKRAEKELTAAKTSESRSGLANIIFRKLRDENPLWEGKDLQREASKIIAQQAIDRRYAGGQGANQMNSLNTVADHLKLMSEYSEALRTGKTPFTEIPRLNQIIQRIATESGRPEVTNFNVARDIMADEVVRLLTSTGGTEADRAGMQARLAAMMSTYQQTGSLDAFEKFVAGRFKGLEQGYARNDPERVKDFRENLLTPEARSLFTKHGTGEGGAAAPSSAAGGPQEGDIAKSTGKPDLVFRGGKWIPQATPGEM